MSLPQPTQLHGLPPSAWRGGIRTSCSFEHGDPFHAGPCLGRGAIAKRRVQALPVVEHLDVLEHCRLGLLTSAEPGRMNVLLLERGEEALHRRVVETVALTAHGLLDAVPL